MRIAAAILALVWMGSENAVRAQLVAGTSVSASEAAAAGLQRAWGTYVTVDPNRGQLVGVVLHKGVLFASTSQGVVQAVDAETGASYWTTRVGRPNYITLPPGVNDTYVVVTNGTQLFALERATGRLAFQRTTQGAPCSGPGLSEDHCYVPMYSGAIEIFHLSDDAELDKESVVMFAAGASLAPPIIRGGRLYWTTKRGYIYGDAPLKSSERFQFTTAGQINGGAAVFKPVKGESLVLAGSHDGSVYAVNDPSGTLRWRFQAAAAVIHQPVVISDAVYAINDAGILSRVDLQTGVALWQTAGPARFVAASPTRVYVTDRTGNLLVIDSASGGMLGSVFVGTTTLPFINDQTDRAYLASTNGLIQCLHERSLTKPVVHAPPQPPATPMPPAIPEGTVPTETTPTTTQ